eukprot:CAMPEP_0201103898 /NCGR_PEP_ID=MMETSP0812-20130820/33609_1 /ASSEMBLY_ACC=CAM_ASM_000668 /TAXON_ID=98059 /ORGANISM="Dinobryon sp., Strain UTEXLB2267" /LENGTH=36 /DNA_ID= /DNA_START= /DNA_END= /DNA_ORIENTATION=
MPLERRALSDWAKPPPILMPPSHSMPARRIHAATHL